MLNTDDYPRFVEERFKTSRVPIENLLHGAVGVSGEAGELLDAVKKTWVYNKPLDANNIIEELGDIEYYLEAIRQFMGVSREHVIMENMKKLSKRYPTGYSDAAAQARADKA